jgi:hypothetical protein
MASYWGNAWGLAWGNAWGQITSGQEAQLASTVLVSSSGIASALLELRLNALAEVSAQQISALSKGATLQSSTLVSLAAEAELLKIVLAGAAPLVQVVAGATMSKGIEFAGYGNANAVVGGELRKRVQAQAQVLATASISGDVRKSALMQTQTLIQAHTNALLSKYVALDSSALASVQVSGTAGFLQFIASQTHISASLSGNIRHDLNMAGSALGVTSLVANLRKHSIASGSSVISVVGQALPYLGFTIAGSAHSSVSTTASPAVVKRMASSIEASTLSTGYLLNDVRLYGDTSVVVTLEALPSLEFLLSGSADVQAATAGQVSISKELVTSILASASINGSLNTVLVFSGTSQVIVSLNGSLYAFQVVDGLYTLVNLEDDTEVVEEEDGWVIEELATVEDYIPTIDAGVVEELDDEWVVELINNSALLSRIADSTIADDDAVTSVEEDDIVLTVEEVVELWSVEMILDEPSSTNLLDDGTVHANSTLVQENDGSQVEVAQLEANQTLY